MKYPSADSLNHAVENCYNYQKIVDKEQHFLNVIQWELLQYTVLDYLTFFLAQGCFFQADRIISSSGNTRRVTADGVVNMRRYAEFFTDFAVQDSDLIRE